MQYGYGQGPPPGPPGWGPPPGPPGPPPGPPGWPPGPPGSGWGPLPPEVQALIAQQNQQILTLGQQNRQLYDKVSDFDRTLREFQEKQAQKLAPRFIEDIPGKREAYWWLVSIDANSAVTDGVRFTGSQTLGQDGPFIINSVRCFWRVRTASAAANGYLLRTFLPPCKLPFLIEGSSVAVGTSNSDARLVDVPDWFFQFEISGGRNWQNAQVPGAAFLVYERPEYLGVPGWIDRNQTLSVTMTASVPATAPDSGMRGDMYVVMSGYRILRPINYAEAFGFVAG